MKKIFTLSFIVVLFSCAGNKGDNIITVSLPNEGEDLISWLDIFPDAEMIRLTGEELPLLNFQATLTAQDNMYYVSDRSSGKIFRFDQNGKYLNSIGSQGRGPKEYTFLMDAMIDDHGNIAVYDGQELVTYSPDGSFLEKKEVSYSTLRFFSFDGFNYHYVGNTYDEYQLYVTDSSGEVVEQLPSSSKGPTMPNSRTFSLYGNTLYFCPGDGGYVYQLKNGKAEVKYGFNFKEYHTPDEYDFDYLLSHTVAFKNAFYENRHCAILWVLITRGVEVSFVYGIQNKQQNIWKWFSWDEGDFVLLQCFDEEYAYFTADPAEMKQIPGMVERFPLLNTLTNNDSMVILKCKTASIKL